MTFQKGYTPYNKGGTSWNKGIAVDRKKYPIIGHYKPHSEKTKKLIGEIQIGQHHSPTSEIKKGQRLSPATEFQKGSRPKNWKGGIDSKSRIKYAPRPKTSTCEVCGRSGRICLDHDHKTGEFRGWLCIKCNSTLGFVDDNPEILVKLISYLNRI